MSSAATADGRDSIELYLSRLDAALHTVPASEREEFVREIRGHIFERLEQSNDVAAVLAGVGDPEELAKQFCTETSLVQLARTGSPWRLMRTAARWALSGSQGFSMFMVALVGYGLGASFYISAMLKPIFPDHVGIFVYDGNFNIGFDTAAQRHDISGPYFTLYAMIAGFLLVAGTTALLRVMVRRFAAVKNRLGPPAGHERQWTVPSATALRDSVRTWSPWKLLRTATRWALTGIHGFAAFLVGLVGYVIGATFYLTAILKPVYPDHIGVFVGGGKGLQLAAWPAPTGHEIAGPYYTVIAIMAGFLLIALTTAVLRQMMEKVTAAKRALA